jgi:hypothetical protein
MVYRNGKKYTEFNKARNENNLHDFIQKNMLKTIKKPQIKRVIAKPIRKRAIRNKPKQK